LWRQLGQLLNSASLLRISLGTAILSGSVILVFKWAVPQLVLPNLWPLLFALPGIVLALVGQFAILSLIPPMVTIRADKIIVQHGQSATIIDPRTVTATKLTFHSENRVRLRIHYTRKSKAMSRVIGVPVEVNFQQLSEMLPILPVVRDARSRRLKANKNLSQDNSLNLGK
jgi:hypothetical protein